MASTEIGIYAADYTGQRDPAVMRRSPSAPPVARDSADFSRHLSSGTLDPDTRHPTAESPLPGWEDSDIPDDLVPNRTDLEGGPRQHLTSDLEAERVLRPDPRLVAARMLAAKRKR